MKNTSNITITELFLVKSDWNHTFIGQISRQITENNIVIHGNVVVEEGKIWCEGESETDIGNKLDTMCVLKLKYGINDSYGISIDIINSPYFLN